MPSTVRVCMRVCDKTCRITAVHCDDAISVELESDCSKLQQFGEELAKGVPMDDILDIYSSRIIMIIMKMSEQQSSAAGKQPVFS